MNESPPKQLSNRAFGLIFAAIFFIIAVFPVIFGNHYRVWALTICGLFCLLALLFPIALKPLNNLWTKFGFFMHKIINPILMGLVFFCTVLPTGIVLKLLKKDPMQRRYNPEAPSYWQTRETPITKNSFDNQF